MAVPVWASKLGVATAKGLLGGDEDGKNFFRSIMLIVGGIIALLFALIVTIPAVLLHLPLANDNQLATFYSTVKSCGKDGVEIPWEEVAAVYGALHNQDYSGASWGGIRNLADNWLERHEEKIRDEDGNVVDTKVHYTLRSMNDVMDLLNMSNDQKALAGRFLEGLKSGSMAPPPGWVASSTTGTAGWNWPLPGYDSSSYITCPFGFRIDPITKEPSFHHGVDIGVPEGTPVFSARDGIIKDVKIDSIYGLNIVVQSGPYIMRYAHLSTAFVSAGANVKKGDIIARSGNTGRSTGPHLHFEVKFMGKYMNPLEFF